jgi:hypothetical protein
MTMPSKTGELVETDEPDDRASWDVPKVRQCLLCEARFQSAWSGERICTRCKSKDAWRRGAPRQVHPAGRGG